MFDPRAQVRALLRKPRKSAERLLFEKLEPTACHHQAELQTAA